MTFSKSARSSSEISRLATFGTSCSPPVSFVFPERPVPSSFPPSVPALSAAGICCPPHPASRPQPANTVTSARPFRGTAIATLPTAADPTVATIPTVPTVHFGPSSPYCLALAATSVLSSEITGVGDIDVDT